MPNKKLSFLGLLAYLAIACTQAPQPAAQAKADETGSSPAPRASWKEADDTDEESEDKEEAKEPAKEEEADPCAAKLLDIKLVKFKSKLDTDTDWKPTCAAVSMGLQTDKDAIKYTIVLAVGSRIADGLVIRWRNKDWADPPFSQALKDDKKGAGDLIIQPPNVGPDLSFYVDKSTVTFDKLPKMKGDELRVAIDFYYAHVDGSDPRHITGRITAKVGTVGAPKPE